jgi:3-oxoadipate enol-lactonase
MIRSMVSEHRVELLGRPSRYLVAGAGWPLVLLHADMWRPQLDRVPRGWRLIAPDLRGAGGAPLDEDSALTMEDLAAEVVALLDHLELERAVIGGLSLGGYVTFALLRMAPERFSGLVLANTRPQADSADGRTARRSMSELVRAKGTDAVADQMLPKLLGQTTKRTRPAIEQSVRRIIQSNAAPGVDALIHAMMNRPDSTPVLGRISNPTLILAAAEDAIIPLAEAEAMNRAIPRSQLVVLQKAGHIANLESPDDFSEAIQNFVLSNL